MIQGDTLWNLHEMVKGIVADLRGAAQPVEGTEELADLLNGFLKHYEATPNAHGIPLPYFKPS